MRPIRLKLQAFGPFVGKEVVDFRAAIQAGLFGIYGATGAGKSTIFSAMCFALFGDPTKAEQKASALRSDRAADTMPTEVELIFELGTKTYMIRRRPEQERQKARGEGTTTSFADASLFDVTGLSLEAIDAGDQGRLIAEKKVSLVTQHVMDLLGYGVDQFRQIVLLPQGKFETFLAANSGARMDILRELFDVAIYRDLSERLKNDAKAVEDDLQNRRRLCGARLNEKGFSSDAELQQGILDAQALVADKEVLKKTAEQANTAAIAEHAAAKGIEEKFQTVDREKRAFDDLDAKTAPIERLAQRVTAVQNAAKAQDLEQAWQTAQSGLKVASAILDEAKRKRENAAAAAEIAREKKSAADAQKPLLEQASADLARLEDTAKQVETASGLQATLNAAASAHKMAVEELKKAEDTYRDLSGNAQKADQAFQSARSSQIKKSEIKAALSIVERDLECAIQYQTAKESLEKAEAELADKTLAAHAASATFDLAEAKLSQSQAIILAVKLVNGAPCPVCGALDHPNPAQGHYEPSGLGVAFNLAKETKATSDGEVSEWTGILKERQGAFDQQSPPERALAELKDEQARLKSESDALGPAVDLAELETELSAVNAAAEKARMHAVEMRDAAGKALNDLTAAGSRLEGVLGGVPEGLRSVEAVEARRRDLEAAQGKLASEIASAEQAERNARDALTKSEAEFAAAQKATNSQEGQVKAAYSAFTARLGEVGLDEATYQNLKAYFGTLKADDEAIKAHHLALNAARTTLQNATRACQGQQRPILGPLEIAVSSAKDALDAANTDFAAAAETANALVNLRESLAEALEKANQLEQESGPLRALADLTNGKNDAKTTLETFAIVAMFERVLEATNLRLDPMTRGRYRLLRATETAGGRGKKGLDLEVFDVNSGKSRSTTGLSGGETFIAALALALGLADVVESMSGKIRMDTIFIDEGFGSLDVENGAGTLDQVLQVLTSLTQGSRAVGLISHVGLVQSEIRQGFYVRKTGNGSIVEERRVV
jgi:exonuclease SbcC